jgi:RNA polymerase sigma factor (sigma-70 family)
MQDTNAPARARISPCPNTDVPARLVGLRGDESDLYRAHHRTLIAATRRMLRADEALIEDACQFAWVQFCRFQPDRGEPVFAWLRKVAYHEGLRLLRHDARYPRAVERVSTEEGMALVGLEPDETPGAVAIEDELEARRALRAVARLPERQREYVELRLAGHTYEEIVAITGRTYTNVNKHLTRAREALRAAA